MKFCATVVSFDCCSYLQYARLIHALQDFVLKRKFASRVLAIRCYGSKWLSKICQKFPESLGVIFEISQALEDGKDVNFFFVSGNLVPKFKVMTYHNVKIWDKVYDSHYSTAEVLDGKSESQDCLRRKTPISRLISLFIDQYLVKIFINIFHI